MISYDTIEGMYYWPNRYGVHTNNYVPEHPASSIFLDIPLSSKYIEVPVFAMDRFTGLKKETLIEHEDSITLSAYLQPSNLKSSYKSLERGLQDLLPKSFTGYLYNCPVTQAGETKVYFVTHGMILDPTMKPLMMATWQLEKISEVWACKRPLLRLDSGCFTNIPGAMEKIIIKKILPLVLMRPVNSYNSVENNSWYRPRIISSSFSIKVEIESAIDMPFKFFKTESPSISTTNESLLQLALEHIDELTA